MSTFIPSHMYKTHLPEEARAAHPLTPPETDYDYVGQSHRATPASDFEAHQYPVLGADSPSGFHRRTSSVVYINSGPKDTRDRMINRASKWLIVVFPPPSFSNEHGQFGHTLSSGPSDRLSNGVLMPLFPTMSTQLSAIAREYNLPSIVGLCLYLQINQNGLSLRPRITDESWSTLWNIQFEARSPSSAISLPVCGQIEFDLDFNKARWYDAWLGTSRRDVVDVPQSVTPSRPQSVAHFRGDSRSTFVDGTIDGNTDGLLTFQQSKVPPGAPKMVPRKLSLVDRFDTLSAKSTQKLPSGDLSPPSPTPHAQLLHALSPIIQEEEPKSAKKDIDDMVNSWRASAKFSGNPLRSIGQISLDPVNMPNTLESLPTASSASFELNLDDYAWSVSSLGPNYDSDMESCPSEDRVPSIHVDRRAAGSVALTPSVCTSFGWDAEDDDVSLVSSVSRLPSPDIAERALSDAPLTPATATSWGPPSSYPISPMLASSPRAPSVDIGRRNTHSQPVTPLTATSWGPPSYPVSPGYGQYALGTATPDLAGRILLSLPPTPFPSRLRQPSTFQTRGSIQIWALDAVEAGCHEGTSAPVADSQDAETAHPYGFVFPYYHPPTGNTEVMDRDVSDPASVPGADSEAAPWHQVWPYIVTSAPVDHETDISPQFTAASWGLVWPYTEVIVASPWRPVWPSTEVIGAAPWEQVWPYTEADSRKEDVDWKCHYPCFDIYPAIYPHFQLYPAVMRPLATSLRTSSNSVYPCFDLYPAVYPHFNLYPPVIRNAEDRVDRVPPGINSRYPVFDIYPAVYPNFDLYPAVLRIAEVPGSAQKMLTKHTHYPVFEIYPPVYPHFDVYPRIPGAVDSISPLDEVLSTLQTTGRACHYPVFDIYPAVTREGPPLNALPIGFVWLPARYPHLEVYVPTYPNNLDRIYPSLLSDLVFNDTARKVHREVSTRLPTAYPGIHLYPVVYPNNLREIYPSILTTIPLDNGRPESVSLLHRSQYPAFDIDPTMQSSPPRHSDMSDASRVGGICVSLEPRYPQFRLYPATYPNNLKQIYPVLNEPQVERYSSNILSDGSRYPMLNIYPAVYPHNVSLIYPPCHLECVPGGHSEEFASFVPSARKVQRSSKPNATSVAPLSRDVQLLQPVAPASSLPPPTRKRVIDISVVLPVVYPNVCPYPFVYPFFAIYPAYQHVEPRVNTCQSPSFLSTSHHAYPVIEVYPAVYPFVTPYPSLCHIETSLKPLISSRRASRRRPKYTHADLHRQVFADTENSSVLRTTKLPEDSSAPRPTASRVPTLRSRSGTVSARPPFPPVPLALGGESANLRANRTSIISRSLPMVPQSSADGIMKPRVVGLPTHPAMMRRHSSRPPSSFVALPTVPEPELSSESSDIGRIDRTHEDSGRNPALHPPQVSDSMIQRSNSMTLPRRQSVVLNVQSSLGRSDTVPIRTRRQTAVFDKVKAFDAGSVDDEPMRITMSALAQFPAPPLPPVPSLQEGGNRRISKLDRSKYPFS